MPLHLRGNVEDLDKANSLVWGDLRHMGDNATGEATLSDIRCGYFLNKNSSRYLARTTNEGLRLPGPSFSATFGQSNDIEAAAKGVYRFKALEKPDSNLKADNGQIVVMIRCLLLL